MRVHVLLTVITLILPQLAACETRIIPTVSEEQLRQFARARFDDSYELLLGPTPPRAAVVAEGDCHELYARRVALMRRQLDYRQTFWDEPRHSAAVFVGAMWTPAFYYLPYRALADVLAREDRSDDTAELDALRAVSAAERCFER